MPIVDVDRLKEQGRRFVDGFTPGQKAMTILGVIAVVLAGSVFMKWASTPNYAPLYTGLSSADAGAVTNQLTSAGVKFKITGGGGTILVPQQDVYKERINLAAKSIPSGGDSFSLLDKAGITTDQFTRNVDYQRALQGELANTIQNIDTVSSATVTLTIPQDTVFVGGNQDKPTAAVLVKSSGTLPSSAVTAIVNLVASSIPNMAPEDVTVADTSGNVLHAPGMQSSLAGSQVVEQQQAVESSIQQKVAAMIASSLGPGHATVTVSADLDSAASTSHATTYTQPVKGKDVAIQKNDTGENLSQPNAASTQGVIGVGGNGATPVAGGGTTTYKKTTNTDNLAVNSTTTDSTQPAGTLKRLSVSVLLDSNAVTQPADVTTKWIPAITAAAGIDATRDGKNALVVQTVPFSTAAKNAAAGGGSGASGAAANPMMDLLKHLLVLMMIGLVLFFAWRAIKRAENNRVPLRVPIDLRELEAPAFAPIEAPVPVAPTAARKPIEPPKQSIEGEITELIERQPEEVAQTLRSWLADRRS